MDELSTLTIWFSSYIAGMILTLLMPKLFSEPSRIERNQENLMRMASYDQSETQKTLTDMVCSGLSRESSDLQTCCPTML
jgi:hypothetical protein